MSCAKSSSISLKPKALLTRWNSVTTLSSRSKPEMYVLFEGKYDAWPLIQFFSPLYLFRGKKWLAV